MGSFKLSYIAATSLIALISASPCPYGQLAERGELSPEDSANFFAARSAGNSVVEDMMHDVQKREFDRQEEFYKRQLDLGSLLLGGGLLNGVLQPFSGVLASLDGKSSFAWTMKIMLIIFSTRPSRVFSSSDP